MATSDDNDIVLQVIELPGVLCTLSTSEDGVKLFLQVEVLSSDRVGEISRQMLLDALEATIDISVVNLQVLDDILRFVRSGKSTKKRRIAKGSGAVPGMDGRVDYLVDLFDVDGGDVKPDFLTIPFIKKHDPIKARTIVARVYSPSTGQYGTDVFGEAVVVKDGQRCEITFDDTLVLQDPPDGSQTFKLLVAQKKGYLALERGILCIKDKLYLRGDVDVGSGNIDHYASVEIGGDVMKDFKVKAQGDIVVKGNVIGGSVISEAGNVYIFGSITGMDLRGTGTNLKAKIFDFVLDETLPRINAHGDVRCKAARDAHIQAGLNVLVEKELFSSLVRAGGAVLVPQGHLLGGEIFAVTGVEASIIGSDGGGKTSIFLCSNIESTNRFANVVNKINQYERALEDVRLHLGSYADASIDDDNLSNSQKVKLKVLRERFEEFSEQLKVLKSKKKEMMSMAHFSADARICVKEKVWAHTVLNAKDVSYELMESLDGPISLECSLEDETFKQIKFAPLECS